MKNELGNLIMSDSRKLLEPYDFQQLIIDKAKEFNYYAYFADMGCLVGDTKIRVSYKGCSREITLEKLYQYFTSPNRDKSRFKVRSYKEIGIGLNQVMDVQHTGTKPCYQITLSDGKTLIGTADHKILTSNGWINLKDTLNEEVYIEIDKKHVPKKRYNLRRVGTYHKFARKVIENRACCGNSCGGYYYVVEIHRAVYEAYLNALPLEDYLKATYVQKDLKYIDPAIFHVHHKDRDPKNNRLSNLQLLTTKEHYAVHREEDTYTNKSTGIAKVVAVRYVGRRKTYDISMRSPYNNYIANGVVVHNTGKSLMSINNIRLKYVKHGGLLKTLVFCPIIVLRNWKKEFMMSTQIPAENIGVVEGSTAKKRLKIINNPEHHVLIINYESLRTLAVRQALRDKEFQIVVCDESHKIKNPNTSSKKTRDKKKNPDAFQGTFKEVYKLSANSLYRYILTGTPITNDALDMFSQFLFLDRGRTFGTNFYSFRNRYFINLNANWGDKNSFAKWVFNESLITEFQAKIDRISTRVLKEDVLPQLPKLRKQTLEIPLSPEQEKHYKQIKDELITWLDGQEDNPLMVKNALTKILRLNEIASGYMKLADGTTHIFKDNPRLKGLMELIKDLAPQKIIVFAVYSENYKAIINELEKEKIKYVELTGRIKTKDKLDNVDKFTEDESIQVCLANPRSAGLGVNLKAAGYSAYYTRDFSLADYQQSRDRNHRAGSEDYHDKIMHYHFLAPKTVDEKIFARLFEKETDASEILDTNKFTLRDIKEMII